MEDKSELISIAVDAMGGDYAPGAVVEGVAQALYNLPKCHIVLVGHQEKLRFYLMKYGIANHPLLSLRHAETVVEMAEPSASALRSKKDSSITECARLMKAGEVQAIVSPGHTGAAVAATTVLNRTLPGIDRPALAVNMPQRNGRFILIDGGANPDCKNHNLVQFALMGEIYAQYLLGSKRPSIGLLSVGGEDAKGNSLTKDTFHLLADLPMNFVGNIESNTAFDGGCDVLVCDGFSGNVLLKTSEGLARLCVHWLKDAIKKNALRVTGALLAKSAFEELRNNGSADEAGGALLLGINGLCVIGHGSSSPRAVRNAIKLALESIQFGMNERIVQRLAECKASTAELEAKNARHAELSEEQN